MKEKVNQMFKDKLFLVMLVLGLLTIVAAAGIVTMKSGEGQQNPYLNMQDSEKLLSEDSDQGQELSVAGESNAQGIQENTDEKLVMDEGNANQDTAAREKAYEAAGESDVFGSADQSLAEAGASYGDGSALAEAAPAGSGLEAAAALVLDFKDDSKMMWPIQGNVILDYSMDSTIYFPTLDQYKCNPGLVIQGEVSCPVYAPANARVTAAGVNEEIGNYLTLDLGNEYTAVCGQLKEVAAVEGEYLEKGQLLGYVAEPTKYYSIEGSNVYFQLKHGEQTVDPLDYLE